MKHMKTSPQGAPTRIIEAQPLDLIHCLIEAGLEAKGSDVSVLDIRDVFDISDYFILFSGRSDRQAQGICNRILNALDKVGISPEFVEGYDEGHWILIDCGDIVVHIFYEPIREQYDLEGLWVRAKRMVLGRDKDGKEVLQAA